MQVRCVQTFRCDDHLHKDNIDRAREIGRILTSTKEKRWSVAVLARQQKRGAAFGEHGGRGLSTRPPNLSPRNRARREVFGGLGGLGGHPSTHKREIRQLLLIRARARAHTHAHMRVCVGDPAGTSTKSTSERSRANFPVRWSGGRPSNGHPPDVLRRSRCPPAGRNRRACPEGPGGAA
jgi:hypothetical protein